MDRFLLLLLASLALGFAALAQGTPAFDSSAETRKALADALEERRAAETRSQRFERQAELAESEADRTARESAALAARIQEAEAGIAAARVRMQMIDRERDNLRERLGTEQRPVVQLTAALQKFSRRPVALAVLRPGSLRDTVYMRAVLHNTVPLVRERTSGLRNQIARGRELRREAQVASDVLAAEEAELAKRREVLAETETRARLAARKAGGSANREAERALALGEQAIDLESLVGELDRAAGLRKELAGLRGPLIRPDQPAEAELATADQELLAALADDTSAPSPYMLPVAGRTLLGFGAPQGAGLSKGLTLAPLPGAQVISPADGRIVFAGPYRGYGNIVIVEHSGEWVSLITGLARSDVRVGAQVIGGSPLGRAGPASPRVSLELRRGGEPVNPLAFTS